MGCEFRFHKPAYLVGVESSGLKAIDEFTRKLLSCSYLSRLRSCPTSDSSARSYKGPDTMPQLQNPFLLELSVDTRDRVWIDDKRLGEVLHAREAVPRSERTGFARVSNLLL